MIKPLKRLNDERGFFTEMLRCDWKDLLDEDSILQANFATTYPGIIRAWHRHVNNQIDLFVVLRGSLKICAYDEKTKELDEIVSTAQDLQVVRIPGGFWHGYKAIGNETASIVYFVTQLYDREKPDEERRPWNDPHIIPKSINGNKMDPRTGKPWDWNHPPHK